MIRLKTNPSTIREQGDKLGTYHLADNPNLYEIQRSNNYEFIVTDIDGILRAGMQGDETYARIMNAQEVLRISVQSASVPHFTQQPISVRRGNNELKFAGTPTFGSGTIVVNDYIGADTKAVIMAWQHLSYDVYTEKVGLVQDYKKDCYLVEYSPDYQMVRRWILHGCWISGINENDFNNNGNEAHQLTVTIEYDRAELDTSEEI